MMRKTGSGGAGFSPPVRGLPPGDHAILRILPGCLSSPALRLVGTSRFSGSAVLETARVRILVEDGFCWIDDSVPIIILTQIYYQNGSDLDLYLDLLHEATHLRQLLEGRDVWDSNFQYHHRPTEVEAYAVAVAEGRRLGLDEKAVRVHLSNPWMSAADVEELLALVETFLAKNMT